MDTEDNSRWVESGGGPLILIDSDLALEWGGVSWNSGSPESLSDYERACSIDGYLGVLDVQKGQALVLGDEPMRTSVKRLEQDEVIIVRWVWASNETQVIESLPLALESADWLETNLTIRHSSETFVIFDSAEQLSETSNILEIPFSAGLGRISTLEFKPNDSVFLVLHRIKGVASGERSGHP
ncbi:MAG: Imm21 family immunity protein [Pyrinomonadaceae bacterium]